MRITFEIERVPVAVDETPADLARGYEVAPAQVWVMAPPTDARGMATGGETSGLNGGSGGAAAWRASPWQEARSNLLLVSGPYGDHSMLFNVPVLASLATMILVSLVISALTSALHLDYAKGGAGTFQLNSAPSFS